MITHRWNCIAAVLSNNELMVIGGSTVGFAAVATDSVEFAAYTINLIQCVISNDIIILLLFANYYHDC